MPDRYAPERLRPIAEQLSALRSEARALEQEHAATLAGIDPTYRASAANLLHYLAIRRHDVRDLQYRLHLLGLSSLGRMEAYVLATIDAVIGALERLGGTVAHTADTSPVVDFQRGRALLTNHTTALFGPAPDERDVRIMVTMPTAAAEDYELVHELVAGGMNVMRLNCSKDGPDAWLRMIEFARRAEVQAGKSCRVLMDLAGPNPRTTEALQPAKLSAGDWLTITARDDCDPASFASPAGQHAIVGCTLPDIVRDVNIGDRFYYDDGALSGKVIAADGESFTVEILYARKGAKKVKADKGINLPDTNFRLPSLTPDDVENLDFIVAHADMVGMSFVRCAADVDQLVEEIVRRQAVGLGVVLKIETRRAFDDLPKLLLSAMRVPPVGVMVARGDMGVELGFHRMAEVQEEVLWLAEAAHVPVIWATQVLESLAKYGMPSRAEVTDAAMSSRAECVMLNKGEHIVEAVRFLDDVLRRMGEHQHKKLAMLRKLSVSQRL
jgi:pyruvate kinase